MSAFAHAAYDSASYLRVRPKYPASLFSYLAQYHAKHSASARLALDVGCGPGEATTPLTTTFDRVIGVDRSEAMIREAKQAHANLGNLSFVLGSDTTFDATVDAGSVDLLTSAQAVHWFDPAGWFARAHKVLAANGTLAFWGYVDHVFEGAPRASEINLKYCYDSQFLGPYWEPGRARLRQLLVDYEPPSELFDHVERHVVHASDPKPGPLHIVQRVPFAAYRDYLRTFSSYSTWRHQNPQAVDLADQCYEEIKQVEGWTDQTEVQMRWSTVLVLATKR